MKKFLIKVSLFFLPILVLLYPLDKFLSSNLEKSNIYPGEYEVWTDIYGGKINADIAIYGSSRAWVHMNPKLMEDSFHVGVYNFGIDGHNLWMQYLRHLEYFKYNRHPRTIILSVDVFSLQKRNDLYGEDQFLPYMLWNKNVHEYISSYEGYNKYDYYVPLVRYSSRSEAIFNALGDYIRKDREKYRYHGYRGMDLPWNTDFEKAKLAINQYEIKIDPGGIALLDRFVAECRNLNIDVIMVYCPEYIEGQKFVKNREDVINIYASVASKYHLAFLDYSKDGMSMRKELFYNTGHMNREGSNLFTNKLIHDIKSLKQ